MELNKTGISYSNWQNSQESNVRITVHGQVGWSRDAVRQQWMVNCPDFCEFFKPQPLSCGTVCLNSFVNQTSPLDSSNDRWRRLCLISWAAVPPVWTLKALTRNLLAYLFTDTSTYKPAEIQYAVKLAASVVASRQAWCHAVEYQYHGML